MKSHAKNENCVTFFRIGKIGGVFVSIFIEYCSNSSCCCDSAVKGDSVEDIEQYSNRFSDRYDGKRADVESVPAMHLHFLVLRGFDLVRRKAGAERPLNKV